MSRPTVLTPSSRATLEPRRSPSRSMQRARIAARQRRGKALVVAGWITALAGVVLYCAASFTGDTSVDLAAVLLHGAVPAARAALVVVGAGTLLWITGTVIHTNAALDSVDSYGGTRADADENSVSD